MPGRRDARYALLVAAVALEATGIGVLYPLLARIQTAHHLPTWGLGLMSGGAFFAALGAQVAVGPVLDGPWSRRVLLAGLAAGAAGVAWFGWGSSLPELVAARVVGGAGYGIVTPAALREASIGSTGVRRGARLGIISSASMTGIVVGPLAGSLLSTAGGVRLPFEVVAALLAAVLVATAATGRGTPRPPGPRTDATATRGRPVARRTRAPAGVSAASLTALLLLGAAMQLPTGLYDALWSRLLTDRGAGELLIGLSLTLFGLPYVILAPFGGRLAERRGPLLAACIALVISDAFMASYGVVPSPVAITVLGVAEACVQAVAIPGGYAAVARVFPEWRAATGQSWFGGAGTASAGTAALAGAPVYGAFGPGIAFAGGAAMSTLLAGGALLAGRRGPAGQRAVDPAGRPGDPAPAPAGDPAAQLAGDPAGAAGMLPPAGGPA